VRSALHNWQFPARNEKKTGKTESDWYLLEANQHLQDFRFFSKNWQKQKPDINRSNFLPSLTVSAVTWSARDCWCVMPSIATSPLKPKMMSQ
jgi:hypothetical protein